MSLTIWQFKTCKFWGRYTSSVCLVGHPKQLWRSKQNTFVSACCWTVVELLPEWTSWSRTAQHSPHLKSYKINISKVLGWTILNSVWSSPWVPCGRWIKHLRIVYQSSLCMKGHDLLGQDTRKLDKLKRRLKPMPTVQRFPKNQLVLLQLRCFGLLKLVCHKQMLNW